MKTIHDIRVEGRRVVDMSLEMQVMVERVNGLEVSCPYTKAELIKELKRIDKEIVAHKVNGDKTLLEKEIDLMSIQLRYGVEHGFISEDKLKSWKLIQVEVPTIVEVEDRKEFLETLIELVHTEFKMADKNEIVIKGCGVVLYIAKQTEEDKRKHKWMSKYDYVFNLANREEDDLLNYGCIENINCIISELKEVMERHWWNEDNPVESLEKSIEIMKQVGVSENLIRQQEQALQDLVVSMLEEKLEDQSRKECR